MTIEFKACTFNDLHALQTIARATFEEAFSAQNDAMQMQTYLDEAFSIEQLQREFETNGTSFFLLYSKGELAGYLKLNAGAAQTEHMGETKLEIERIYLKRAFQGAGLGHYLIQSAIDFAQQLQKTTIWLGVWEENKKAISFYERVGFQKTGTHVFMLGDEEQLDYIMEMPLLKA